MSKGRNREVEGAIIEHLGIKWLATKCRGGSIGSHPRWSKTSVNVWRCKPLTKERMEHFLENKGILTEEKPNLEPENDIILWCQVPEDIFLRFEEIRMKQKFQDHKVFREKEIIVVDELPKQISILHAARKQIVTKGNCGVPYYSTNSWFNVNVYNL